MDLVRYIVARLHPLLRRSCRSFPDSGESRAVVGRLGEKAAGLWLQARGVRILRRNYRADSGGEVDIVCREGDVLVFCEVKTRTGVDYGPPSRAVNREKRNLIRRGARSWLRKLKRDVPFRFDIMEVLMIPGAPLEIRRITHAFDERERR